MDNSPLLIETFYSRQLLNEEVKFYDQYQSIHGNRTKEFFGYYRDGLAIQKELVMEIQSIEITEKILQEKFGDNFAAKVAGFGKGAINAVGNLASAGGFGSLGKAIQSKIGGSVKGEYETTYLNLRNKNFTRSLGDYFAQLKTFDKNVPDAIGGIPVKKSGVLKGLTQKGGQIAGGVARTALSGANVLPYGVTGAAVAAVGGAEKLTALLNKKFNELWENIKNTKPVQDFDRMFEEKKKSIRDNLSKLGANQTEQSNILKIVDQLGAYAKANTVKTGIVIGLLATVAGLAAGPIGFALVGAKSVVLVTSAVLFMLRAAVGALKGESASTAIGNALKTSIVGWLTGQLFQQTVGPFLQNMMKMSVPTEIGRDIMTYFEKFQNEGYVHVQVTMNNWDSAQKMTFDIAGSKSTIDLIATSVRSISQMGEDLANDELGTMAPLVTKRMNQEYINLYNYLANLANDGDNKHLVKAFQNAELVMATRNSIEAATDAFNQTLNNNIRSATSAFGAVAAGGGTPGVTPNKINNTNESTMLLSILKNVLSEAAASTSAATPVVGAVPLTANQENAVKNLKQNIEKEMRQYIQDVAKTFNASGNNTTEVLNSLKNIEGAKSAYELIEKVKADFKKLPKSLNLNFPEDIVVSKSVKDSEKTTGATSTQTSATGEPLTREEENTLLAFRNEFGKNVYNNPKKYDFVKVDSTGKVIDDDNYYRSVFCAFLDEFEKKYPKIYEKYKNTKSGQLDIAKCKNSDATPGATTGAGDSGGSYANKNLAKYVTGLKGSPLFSGNLQQRVVDMLKAVDDPKSPEAKASIATLKTFLIKFSKAISDASAQYRQKVGDPNNVRVEITQDPQFTSLAEAAKDLLAQNKARQAFINDFTAVIPNLVGATFELRQVFNKKNPNSVYNFSVAPAQPPKLPMNEDLETKGKPVVPNTGAIGNLTGPDIANARAMFAKLIDLGLILQGLNPNGFTKANLKQLIITCLDIGDVLVYKKGSKKTNKMVDNALQGLDLLGPKQDGPKQDGFKPKEKTLVMAGQEEDPLTPKSLYQYFGDKWNIVTKDGLKPLDVKGKAELIQKLNTLSKAGRNDYDKAKGLIKTKKNDKSKGISSDVGNQIKEGSPYNLSDYRKFFI